jgi:hypothetical protein
MAWTCTGSSNKEVRDALHASISLVLNASFVKLIDNMRKAGLIKSARVAEASQQLPLLSLQPLTLTYQAMAKTDRRHYVPDKEYAYQDCPQYVFFNLTRRVG